MLSCRSPVSDAEPSSTTRLQEDPSVPFARRHSIATTSSSPRWPSRRALEQVVGPVVASEGGGRILSDLRAWGIDALRLVDVTVRRHGEDAGSNGQRGEAMTRELLELMDQVLSWSRASGFQHGSRIDAVVDAGRSESPIAAARYLREVGELD